MDPAFEGAGKKEGMEMWRIEALKPVKMSAITGKFFEGDSYILLSTVKKNSALNWNLHFWLGKDTSQDESGIAAYKTVELDDSLGGAAVQYREVQGSESSLFISYFKKSGGVEYIPGGIASGFKHVEKDVYPTRLLLVKGSATPRVSEVPLATSSLTQSDAFVLDMGLEIYIFVGPTANRQEKMKASEVACHLDDDERGGRAIVYRLEDDPQNATFWGALGGYVDPNSLSPGLPDQKPTTFENKIFVVKDADGEVTFIPVDSQGGKLRRDMLLTEDVFLIHTRDGIFLWIGKGASQSEKKEAMSHALKYMASNGVPNNTPVQKVSEGVEPSSFIKEFFHWTSRREVAKKVQAAATPIDAAAFVGKTQADDMKDDIVAAEEKLQVWRIENFKAVEELEELYGQFYSGDSYILLYTFKKTKQSKEEHIIYFWQGQNSSTDEKGASALLAKELDDKMGGSPVQCRVVQGKEPLHFRRLFKGKMIIHQGGVPSGFRKVDSPPSEAAPPADVALYVVHGATPMTTFATELVKPEGSALNANDCFILVTPSEVFVFKGSLSTDQELSMADTVAVTLAKGKPIVNFSQGSEPEAFWAALGGLVTIPDDDDEEECARDPRLFLASTITGNFQIEEIDNFDQTDLADEDVMILDAYDEIYVWIGHSATQDEEGKAMSFATSYIEAASKTDGRSVDTSTTRVEAGKEPSIFTRFFVNWDENFSEKNKFVDPYEAKKAKALAAKEASTGDVEKPVLKPVSIPVGNAGGDYYPYEVLKGGSLPAGIVAQQKETYLSDTDFVSVFKMSKADFNKQPAWKRDAQKKQYGLF